jgi:hypothetical protein
MAIWQSCIAKYLLRIWSYFIAKCTRAIWRHPIAKHMLPILEASYCLNRYDRVSSLYWTRGSKQCFSHFSLILVLLFLFSVFAKLLLTNFFAPFSAAWKSDFLSCFSYLWQSKLVHRRCAPIFLAQNMWVS